MNNWRYKFQQFMQGRYGIDQLYNALLVIYLILLVLNILFRKVVVFGILSWAVLIFAFYRFFSRNIEQRELENRKFLQIWGKVSGGLNKVDWQTGSIRRTPGQPKGPSLWTKIKDFPQKKYARCPQCGATLRLPRQRGKHTARCPRCNHRFGVNILIGKK